MSKVYVQTDADNRIIAINSDAFLIDLAGWIQIDEGDGDRFSHAQSHYLPKDYITDDFVYRYKLANGKVVERTVSEIQADIDAIPEPEEPAEIRATKVMFRALAQTDVISAEDALDNQEMFPAWEELTGKEVPSGIYLRYEDGLYRVQQKHTVQAHYPPGVTTAALYSAGHGAGGVGARAKLCQGC